MTVAGTEVGVEGGELDAAEDGLDDFVDADMGSEETAKAD